MIEAIQKKILLNAPVERVWSALTNADELSTWMLMLTDFVPEIGKNFYFRNKPIENWDGFFRCNVKEIEENKKLAFTWNTNLINTETLVTIELTPAGSQTELTLIHSGWEKLTTDNEVVRGNHSKGWDLRIYQHLKNLVEAEKSKTAL